MTYTQPTVDPDWNNRSCYFWVLEYDETVDRPYPYYTDKRGRAHPIAKDEKTFGWGMPHWLPYDSNQWRDDHRRTLERFVAHMKHGFGGEGMQHLRADGRTIFPSLSLVSTFVVSYKGRSGDTEDDEWNNGFPRWVPKRSEGAKSVQR